jgi:hypothetical protein
MQILIDRRREEPGPGLHALVIGVSKYQYLPDVDDPPDEATWNLKSLGSPAISAALVCEWIEKQHNTKGLALPLKTLRVLISPTRQEIAALSVWPKADKPDYDNVNEAVRSWHTDCQDSKSSVAFFYYSGHGFARGRGEANAILTMYDLF